jgi:hypothetical protein
MYQPSPELKKLETEKAEAEQQLIWEQHKYQRLYNREQYYKKRERTARAHRLITRGAAVESVFPLVKMLGEVEFFSLVERIFSMPEVKGMVMEAVNTHNAAKQSGGD